MFLKRNTALHATAYILYMNYIFELFILMSIYLTIQKIYSFPMNWLLQTKHNLYLPNQASNWQTCYSVLYNIITCRRVTTSGVTYSLMKKVWHWPLHIVRKSFKTFKKSVQIMLRFDISDHTHLWITISRP